MFGYNFLCLKFCLFVVLVGEMAKEHIWANLQNLLETLDRFLGNYLLHCHRPQYRPSLSSELEQFRQRFHRPTISGNWYIKDLHDLLRQRLSNESCLVRLNDQKMKYYFFGDLHGSLSDIALIRNRFWVPSSQIKDNHFIFLGDYVDRGIHGFEVTIYLFLLKVHYPNNITLLRGNHEFCDMNCFSFQPELQQKFGPDLGLEIWSDINALFSLLPYAALVNENIFCCHGAIPRSLKSMDQIEQIPKMLKELEEDSIAFELVWNDFRFTPPAPLGSQGSLTPDVIPRKKPRKFSFNKTRGAGYMIGYRAVERFMRRFRFSCIVRAHDFTAVRNNGYHHFELQNGAIFTLFSNSNYAGTLNNTAYLCLDIADETVRIFPLVKHETMGSLKQSMFNQSELIETNQQLIDMKFKDPYEELSQQLASQQELGATSSTLILEKSTSDSNRRRSRRLRRQKNKQ